MAVVCAGGGSHAGCPVGARLVSSGAVVGDVCAGGGGAGLFSAQVGWTRKHRGAIARLKKGTEL